MEQPLKFKPKSPPLLDHKNGKWTGEVYWAEYPEDQLAGRWELDPNADHEKIIKQRFKKLPTVLLVHMCGTGDYRGIVSFRIKPRQRGLDGRCDWCGTEENFHYPWRSPGIRLRHQIMMGGRVYLGTFALMPVTEEMKEGKCKSSSGKLLNFEKPAETPSLNGNTPPVDVKGVECGPYAPRPTG